MKILKVGDTQRVACNHCKSFECATFQLRDVPFSDGSGMVKNVLTGVCNKCNTIAVIPHQSTPAIKKQLESQRKSVEVRVPAHMIDILNLASYELCGNIDFVPTLMKFYIHALSTNEISSKGMSVFLDSDLSKGKAQKRLSIKGKKVEGDLAKLKEITNIPKTSALFRSLILKINDDLLVKKNAKSISCLNDIAASMA